MLEGYDIIVFTYADWHAVKSTPQHIAKLLAEKNRVLFVDMPRSMFRFFRGVDVLGAAGWTGERVQEMRPNLHVYHPPHCFLPVGDLPFGLSRITWGLNSRLLGRLVRRCANRLGFKNPILWNFSPLHGGALRHIPHRLTVHDICDEWSNYLPDGGAKRLMEWIDRKLTAESDITFAFSNHMKSRREGLSQELHVVLPAGDVDHYSKANDPALEVPDDLACLSKPLVGAICVVDHARFDPGLLARMAQLRPDWTVAILGPVRENVDLSALADYPSLRIMHNRPLEMMPAYLKGFDVAIVPYGLNDATRGIYPMKLQEYLAAGKPVVAPRLPECQGLADVVYFADGHDDFVGKVALALAEDGPERREARRAVAARNSWRHRLEERSGHVLRLLENR